MKSKQAASHDAKRSPISIEPLAARRLMAFSSADLLPLHIGDTATFSATVDGTHNTILRTQSAATVYKTAVVRVRDTSKTGPKVITDHLFNCGKSGLLLYGLTQSDTDVTTLQLPKPIQLLPRTFNSGQVSVWNNTPANISVALPGYGTDALAATGTLTGRCIVTGGDRVTKLGFSLLSSVQLHILQTGTFTGTFHGKTYTVTIANDETTTLGQGVGVIGSTATLSVHVNGVDINNSDSTTQTADLSATNRLSTFVKKTGATLRVGGSAGNDVIGVGYDGDASKILVVRNGIGTSVSSSGITRLVIDGAAGNDVIGPLKLGRIRSTLIGGLGNDTITGGPGRDFLEGDDGNDILVGGPGSDTILGGAGNDILNGLSGNDSLDGGLGRDQTKRDDADIARISIEVLV